MILIDALYINNSGGKVLLDYLIQELQRTDKDVFYLLDKRVESTVPYLDNMSNNVVFLEASLIKRHKFYLQNKNRFSSVLCFGDLPPSIRLEARVYTYFHQQLYIEFPNNFPLKHKVLFTLKRLVLKYLFRFNDYWMLQTNLIKNNFQKKYNTPSNELLLMPFYPPMKRIPGVSRKKNSFVFISNAPPHKNHVRLINAFCDFFDNYKTGELTITVDGGFPDLIQLINEKVMQKYPIKNIGFIERDKLSEIYFANEFLIYPSLAESLGLGIAEAIECGCKIIGADLPYMYAICEPSIIFDPFDEKSISIAFSEALNSNVKTSNCLIQNKINELIEIL